MSNHLKPLDQQVMVITGASSGIGLATARAAAQAGASLVLIARSRDALQRISKSINDRGGSALAIPCDVSRRTEVESAVREAVKQFGRIDTWINNAGTAIYGRLEDVSESDSRQLFETNFWGVVNGSLAAMPQLRSNRGALINLGSEVSEGVVPLLGMYSASKHAVKGFTDALRVEVQQVDQADVAITLIQPTAVDTPFPQHARNYMDREPKLPEPLIDPEKVAEAILRAATTPTRDVRVGFNAKLNTVMAKWVPSLGDRMAGRQADQQQYDEPPRHPEGALFESSELATMVVGRTHGTGGAEPTEQDGL